MEKIMIGNCVVLCRCPREGCLWCLSRHGTAAPYYILWTHSPADWTHIYDLDDGVTLRNWHFQRLRELWPATRGPFQEQPARNPFPRHRPALEVTTLDLDVLLAQFAPKRD